MAVANAQAKRDIIVSKDALLKSYKRRLKVSLQLGLQDLEHQLWPLQDDVKSMADNFSEIVKLCRVEDETQVTRSTQAEEDGLEMQVRASNMVRAGESLMKLVSDLKIYLILNDFPNVNEAISSNSKMFQEMQVPWTSWI